MRTKKKLSQKGEGGGHGLPRTPLATPLQANITVRVTLYRSRNILCLKNRIQLKVLNTEQRFNQIPGFIKKRGTRGLVAAAPLSFGDRV